MNTYDDLESGLPAAVRGQNDVGPARMSHPDYYDAGKTLSTLLLLQHYVRMTTNKQEYYYNIITYSTNLSAHHRHRRSIPLLVRPSYYSCFFSSYAIYYCIIINPRTSSSAHRFRWEEELTVVANIQQVDVSGCSGLPLIIRTFDRRPT